MTLEGKRFEILESLPTYGPIYVPITHTGLSFFSEGYVVRFYSGDGSSWVANFEPGWTDFSGVYDFPDFNKTVVFAYGSCHIITANMQNSANSFGVGFTHVYQTADHILIAADQVDFTVIEVKNDKVWTSGRISWNGFNDLKFDGDVITGLAFDPRTTQGEGEWEKFSFNYRTHRVIGGTWLSEKITKRWWKFW
jgi:hypothetical protein